MEKNKNHFNTLKNIFENMEENIIWKIYEECNYEFEKSLNILLVINNSTEKKDKTDHKNIKLKPKRKLYSRLFNFNNKKSSYNKFDNYSKDDNDDKLQLLPN